MSRHHYISLCISKLVLIKSANNFGDLCLLELEQRNKVLRWLHLMAQLVLRREELALLAAQPCSQIPARLPSTRCIRAVVGAPSIGTPRVRLDAALST